uniref:Deoxynivalenol-UDP-glucosyltransferase n=1 Tax=Leersia perrieri TaxID=77586 RepID=A0A0D9XFQ3_9ORYZ
MAAESEHGGIHVVLLPYPSQGHVNPILQFAKRLAAHPGVRCTLAVTRFMLLQGEPSTGAVHVAAISDGCDAGGFREARDVDDYLSRLEAHGSDTVDALLRGEAELGRPAHALVYDSFLSWAPRVAARHVAASASFFTQACAVNVAYGHAFAGQIRLPGDEETTLRLPGLSVGLRVDDLPTFIADTSDCPAYLNLVVSQFKNLEMADHVLVNSFHELQPQESEHMASTWRARMVGPTVPSAYLDNRLPDDTSYGFHLFSPETVATRAWLDARPPRSVVYVSFGSVATPSPSQMAEIADGLYNVGKPFLWVVRSSETSKIPDGFVDKVTVAKRGIIVTWCPQLEPIRQTGG